MQRIRSVRCFAAILPLVLLGACATNRSHIDLAVPQPSAPALAQGSKIVVVDTVIDERRFEENPSDPSIPSLKKGRRYALDAEGRASAVARKRNGFGRAIGDIVLNPPQTVETLTRDLVRTGLGRRGYTVVDAADAPDGATTLDVRIVRFWSWFTPGFWVVDMEATIDTLLTWQGALDGEATVTGYGKKSAPTGRDGNYIQAYDRAFADYLGNLDAALERAGF
jgi:hypothetical protein